MTGHFDANGRTMVLPYIAGKNLAIHSHILSEFE
jgi:hypothetical protein